MVLHVAENTYTHTPSQGRNNQDVPLGSEEGSKATENKSQDLYSRADTFPRILGRWQENPDPASQSSLETSPCSLCIFGTFPNALQCSHIPWKLQTVSPTEISVLASLYAKSHMMASVLILSPLKPNSLKPANLQLRFTLHIKASLLLFLFRQTWLGYHISQCFSIKNKSLISRPRCPV